MCNGSKRTGMRSSNTKASDNIITNGALIAVNEGQCMLIVDQGKVAEICSEAGEYTYDSSQTNDDDSTEDGSSISSLVKEKKKRVIIFTLID